MNADTEDGSVPPEAGRPDAASSGLTMSSVTGKLVLSLVREKDYAHAGEEEAIELTLGHLPRGAQQRWLDVGCGIGGTAHYIQSRGWAEVVGADIDPDNVALATERHPGNRFVCSDAAAVDGAVQGPFDVIYLFNAFFLFKAQGPALRAMRNLAGADTRLVIFDYVDRGGYGHWQAINNAQQRRQALDLDTLPALLAEHGWQLDTLKLMHDEYLRWYEELVDRIKAKREAILELSDEAFYEFVLRRYSETWEDLKAGRLGGAIIEAVPVPGER